MSGDFSLFKWESAHLRNKMMSLLHTPIISTFFPLGSMATQTNNFNLVYSSFLSQSATVQFLANNNYDFNKTFYEGIFYLSHQDEKILQDTKRIQDLKNDLRFVDKTVSFEMLAYLNQHRILAEQFFKVSNENELIIPI